MRARAQTLHASHGGRGSPPSGAAYLGHCPSLLVTAWDRVPTLLVAARWRVAQLITARLLTCMHLSPDGLACTLNARDCGSLFKTCGGSGECGCPCCMWRDKISLFACWLASPPSGLCARAELTLLGSLGRMESTTLRSVQPLVQDGGRGGGEKLSTLVAPPASPARTTNVVLDKPKLL